MTDANNMAFYDELASYYDLIFADWDASMQRQGEAIHALLSRYLPDCAISICVLDATAGIGTQSLPLASASIERLRHEAAKRSLRIDAGVADMRTVNVTVENQVDAVLAFDNSVPHLQSDEEILEAFRSFYSALRPGGVCLLSVRDYENVSRNGDTVHPYGVRWREGVRHLLLQAWHWIDSDHYETTFYVIVDQQKEPTVLRTTSRYYAVRIPRLLRLLEMAGFKECQRLDDVLYQPVLVGRREHANVG